MHKQSVILSIHSIFSHRLNHQLEKHQCLLYLDENPGNLNNNSFNFIQSFVNLIFHYWSSVPQTIVQIFFFANLLSKK